MKQLLVLVLIGLSAGLRAQQWEKVTTPEVQQMLKRLGEQQRSTNYRLTYTRVLYRDYRDTIPATSDRGRFARGTGKCYRSEGAGQLVIQTDVLRMVVDSVNQLVVLTKPDSIFQAINMEAIMGTITWEDYTCSRMITVRETRYELASKQPGKMVLQFWSDKKTGLLTHVEILLPPGNYSSESMDDATLEIPRMVMNYSLPESYSRPAEFDLGNWLLPSGNHYKLHPSVPKDYRLEDLRYNPEHN